MFCGCASGSTPVEPGDSTTAAPAASASRRTAASWPRVPPPALIATFVALAINRRRLLDRGIIGRRQLRQLRAAPAAPRD